MDNSFVRTMVRNWGLKLKSDITERIEAEKRHITYDNPEYRKLLDDYCKAEADAESLQEELMRACRKMRKYDLTEDDTIFVDVIEKVWGDRHIKR